MHTTNYFDTFIEVASDTKVAQGNPPPPKAKKTVARLQYELISENPYQYSSDDILFRVHTEKNDTPSDKQEQARILFFSKGQPCLRTSPLAKIYGFGIHCDSEGKVALYGMETEEYKIFLADAKIKKVKAMRSGR
ncbi:MAG: DUF6157 family protein [Petrimonas sp.]|jgi:hypothetical protein|uniref:DUF6157 family protein n=1 Tax=Petrimonas sp. TaxID=2023866 RepID=UPI000E8C28EB|nr:DUF6157 family protein [uncultured Proteiniphilum sp.]MEA4995468.1 DUF6157 family protein [Petrimonas sp.]MEA5044793.1 DUF6157 family protein [Petrimonas sp.]HBG79095.1 hypothetical protein [Porphyromonadaceae bacterium]HMM17430.1 DUF6157 family protein [Petrimonas sp.]